MNPRSIKISVRLNNGEHDHLKKQSRLSGLSMEGAVIVLGCVIFSVFAATPPVVDIAASPVTMVWSYIGELIFNMLILVGTVKMADRVVREMLLSG